MSEWDAGQPGATAQGCTDGGCLRGMRRVAAGTRPPLSTRRARAPNPHFLLAVGLAVHRDGTHAPVRGTE